MSSDLVDEYLDASIVPPPFGSGYQGEGCRQREAYHTSIVPPPFGSGYGPRWRLRPP